MCSSDLSIQIGPQPGGDPSQRRMLGPEGVAVRREPFHTASDLGRLIIRLGEEAPGGSDSNHADQNHR